MSNEELVMEIQKGNTEAKNELWELIYKLVYTFCKPYRAYAAERYMEMDDLICAAWFGVERAIEAYKPEKGYKFNTYLQRHVMNAVHELLGLRGKKQLDTVSLDEPLDEDGEYTRLDTIADEAATVAFEDVEDAEFASWLWGRVERLPEREHDVVLAHYRDDVSHEELGARNGCSRQDIVKTLRRAIQLLRRDKELRQYRLEFSQFYVSVPSFKSTWTSSVELAILKLEQEGLLTCKSPADPCAQKQIDENLQDMDC